MGIELGYQPLLGDSALLGDLKSALEDVYPKIQGRMSLSAEVWRLFEGEKWRHGKGLGKMLIIIDNVLKSAKNMASFFCSWEVLDDVEYPISCIPHLSSEEIMTVFCSGTSELAIDELSIVSHSYEGALQHFQGSVAKRFDESSAADVVYIDLKKASGCYEHLSNIMAHGVKGTVATLVQNWPSDRKQRVMINGCFSDWSKFYVRVPD
eukprot:g36127.t1